MWKLNKFQKGVSKIDLPPVLTVHLKLPVLQYSELWCSSSASWRLTHLLSNWSAKGAASQHHQDFGPPDLSSLSIQIHLKDLLKERAQTRKSGFWA